MTTTDRAPVADPSDEVVAYFTEKRENTPVYEDQDGLWHLFKHEDVTTAMFDAATFSSETQKFIPQREDSQFLSEGNIINMDAPQHKNLRGLIVEVFTPKVVDSLAPRITEITNQLLDEADADGRFDLVEGLTYQLPVIVIAELLGVPTSDRAMFRRWADELLAPQAGRKERLLGDKEEMDERFAAVKPVMQEMNDYLQEHVNLRRQNPTTDLIGRLASAEVNGKGLTDGEIIGFSVILLLAGHITTTSLLGNAIYCFDRFPDAGSEIRQDPTLLSGAIEEVLRFRTPFPRVARATTREVTLSGVTVPADRLLIPWLASANRDPRKFTDAETFDIHRKPSGHLAFGHGVHFCIGSRLARLEGKIALGVMFDRYREFAVDHSGDEIDFRDPWTMNTIAKLPVEVSR